MSDRRANLAVQPVRVEAPHVGVRRYLDDGLGERRQRAGGRVEVEGDTGASRQHPRSSLLHRPRSGLRRRVRQVGGPAQQSGGSVPAACVFFFRRPVNYNTHTHNRLTASGPGLPGTRRNTHPLTPILIIGHPLSTSSIYYDR